MKPRSVFLAAIPLLLLPFLGGRQIPSPDLPVTIQNDPALPLQIESVIPEIRESGKALGGALIAVRNTGSTRCLAYAVRIKIKFSDGTTSNMYVAEDHAQSGITTETGIAPGSVHTRAGMGTVTFPNGSTVQQMEASLEFAEFSDGRTYGPDKKGFGARFKMLRAAHLHERKGLEKIYREKGTEQLLNEIQKP